MTNNWQVTLNFNDGTYNYDIPHIFDLSDPKEGMKATVIDGVRGDGAIIIPGGKKSQEIVVKGTLYDIDGYADLTTLISTMKTDITTNPAVLTLKHWSGSAWVNDWAYSVRRIEPIEWESSSLRLDAIQYSIRFIVISY